MTAFHLRSPVGRLWTDVSKEIVHYGSTQLTFTSGSDHFKILRCRGDPVGLRVRRPADEDFSSGTSHELATVTSVETSAGKNSSADCLSTVIRAGTRF